MAMGPAAFPPNRMLVYFCPCAAAVASAHSSGGVMSTLVMARREKLEPGIVGGELGAPLNPPFETSNGYGLIDVVANTSGGSALMPEPSPLNVVLFWSPERPSNEYMSGAPSSPGISWMPATVAAIAARFPA